MPVGIAALVSTAVAVVVLTWRFAPGTSFLGLPTGATVDVLRQQLEASFGDFSRLVAPVESTDGFMVVLAAILWVFGFFADTAAFRYRGPVQAVIPYASTFVASGILARDAGRAGAALCFLGGMGVYAVTQRALQASERRWIRGESGRGSWSVAVAGGLLAIVAVLAGVVLGPRLPGDTEAVVDLRSLGQGGGSRTVVSPFVGVRSLLGDQSDQILFTVESPTGAYWRLTSLEQYDPGRDIWVSRGTYRRVEDELDPTVSRNVDTTTLDQRVQIEGLGGLWMPAAYQPVRVEGDTGISYDQGSSSVIVRDASLDVDTAYSVTSALPDVTAAALSMAEQRDRVDPVYLQDPDLSPDVQQMAADVTQRAATPYQRALALQDWFRADFTYDTAVDFRDEEDPVAAFLEARAGFCQQFSSTFALMARSLGLPARVAVGFTPGDPVNLAADVTGGDTDAAGTDGNAADGARPGFVVRGRHAHAWPEVYFDGVGWVPFEPTPGRGNPQATSYTGVAPEQAGAPPDQAATTTTPSTTQAPGTPATTTPAGGGVDAVADPRATQDRAGGDDAPRWPWALALLPAVAVLALGARVLARRRRGARLRHDPHGGRVAAAWADTLGWLAAVGIHPGPGETPLEFASRAGQQLGAGPVAGVDGPEAQDEAVATRAVTDLAWAETVRRFGSGDPTEEQCERAEEAASELRDVVRARATRRQQVQHLVG